MSELGKNPIVPGLLDPIDEDPIISPGEIVGGDSIVIRSSLAVYDDVVDIEFADDENEYIIGLVQGLSITANRAIRSVYQIGEVDPLLISSTGQKALNMSSIITEETNLIKALYKCTMNNRDALLGAGKISNEQLAILDQYVNLNMPEGLIRDITRIPFGLMLYFMTGDGDILEVVHLGHCILSSDDNAVEAGTRGIGESNSILWQKTTIINEPGEENAG